MHKIYQNKLNIEENNINFFRKRILQACLSNTYRNDSHKLSQIIQVN